MIKLILIFIAVCAGIWVLKRYVPAVESSVKKTKDGDKPSDELRDDDSKISKKLKWSYVVNIVLLIMTTAHLSCFAAAVLGFPGLLGPIHAVLDENIGNSILIFCIGMIPIVIISIKQGINWKTARTWMIMANILLAVPTVALSYMPGLNPLYNQKVQQMQYNHLNRVANSKLYIKVEEKQVAYYRESKKDWKEKFKGLLDKRKTKATFTHKAGEFLQKDKKYYIANVKSQRNDGPHKLISIYLPDQNGDANNSSKIVWVRMDKEDGIRISSSKIPADTTELQPASWSDTLPMNEKIDTGLAVRSYGGFLITTNKDFYLVQGDGKWGPEHLVLVCGPVKNRQMTYSMGGGIWVKAKYPDTQVEIGTL